MKQGYRIITTFFLVFFVANIVQAQSENTRIIDRIQIDTCRSFLVGKYYLYRGYQDLCDDWLPASELNLNKAISSFEQHLVEHPCNDSTAFYLGYSYYWLISVCQKLNKSENIKEYLEKALLYLPDNEIQYRFEAHCYYGHFLFYGDSLSGIEPDYCKAFDEFNKAIAYIVDLDISTDLLPFYKNLYYQHAFLLYYSYLYNSYYESQTDTIFFCNERIEQPEWIACIGNKQLDQCIDELNRILSIDQPDTQKNNVDTLALVLLGKCYYYSNEYEKAIYCYERSGVTPEQIIALYDIETVGCFLDSYLKLGIEENEQTTALTEAIIEYWRKNYRLFYKDKAIYKDKTGVMSELAKDVILYYYSQQEYEKALDFWFKIRNNFSFEDVLLTFQAFCRVALGDTTGTGDLEFAAHLNPQNGMSLLGMAISNLSEGRFSSNLISNNNDALDGHDTAYYSIRGLGLDTSYYSIQGWACYYQKDYATAKDYFLKLDKSPDNLLMVAICYKKMVEEMDDADRIRRYEAQSERYFREIIQMEDSTGLYSSTPYAYLYLGEPDSAIKSMEHILQTGFPLSIQTADDSLTCWEIHYQAAEIYAQVNQLRLAKRHLKKAFEYDHTPFLMTMAQNAPLLAPIKRAVDKEVNRYKNQEGITESPIHCDTIICDIPFKKNGDSNTRTISCVINGVPVDNMLFDPGAEYVQLPRDIADRIGELYDIGWQRTRNANGNDVCMRIVSLDTVRIGDSIVLENVQAIINEEPGAKLLLGCTVLNNLKVEMPSPANKGMIRLTYIKESIEIPNQ